MSRELIADIVQAVGVLLMPVFTYLLAKLAGSLDRFLKSRTAAANSAEVKALSDTLQERATAIAADLLQHVVADLKDPTKPGTWDEVTKKAVKDEAVQRLRAGSPVAIETLKARGEDVEAMVGPMIERGVAQLKLGAK